MYAVFCFAGFEAGMVETGNRKYNSECREQFLREE
jgi:hypothetical protein